MAVSNLDNLSPQGPYIWIPPVKGVTYKLTLEIDGIETDITDKATNWRVTFGLTESIGDFEFEIYDPDEYWARKLTGNEIFRYYKDFGATATTKRFTGRIERPKKNDFMIKVEGRQDALKAFNFKRNKSFKATDASDIIINIVNSYLPESTTNNVNTNTIELDLDFTDMTPWEMLRTVANATGWEIFIDADNDVHFFESGSRINYDNALVHDSNLFEVKDIYNDNQTIINKVTVIGGEVNGVRVRYSATSDDPDYGINSSYGIRERKEEDRTITTKEQAKNYADYLLDKQLNPPLTGTCKGYILPSILQGDKIAISSPYNGLDPDYYIVTEFTDRFEDFPETEVTISNQPKDFREFMIRQAEADNQQSKDISNPFNLGYSQPYIFTDDIGSNSGTIISGGTLALSSGESSGIWYSGKTELSGNLSTAYVIVNGSKISGATVSVSGNNGVSYTECTNKSLTAISTSGTELKIKIEITDTNTEIQSVEVQYDVS